MALSNEALAEFKALYKTHFNEDLPDQVAYDLAEKLLNLYRAVYQANTTTLPRYRDSNSKKTSI